MAKFKVLFSLYNNDPVLLDKHEKYEDAIKTVIDTNKIVKNARSSKFEIIDCENGTTTHFEATDKGIRIYAKV